MRNQPTQIIPYDGGDELDAYLEAHAASMASSIPNLVPIITTARRSEGVYRDHGVFTSPRHDEFFRAQAMDDSGRIAAESLERLRAKQVNISIDYTPQPTPEPPRKTWLQKLCCYSSAEVAIENEEEVLGR